MCSNDTIGFFHEPMIGVLYLNEQNPRFSVEEFKKGSYIYTRINEMAQTGFNYFYINNILVIEDDTDTNPIFDSLLDVVPFSTQGEFLAFFHAERKGNIWLAGSLTLPDMIYLKEELKLSNIDFIL